MDRSAESGEATRIPGPSHAATTHLRGGVLTVARVGWLALVLPSIGCFVISIPAYYQQLLTGCIDAITCSINGALPANVISRTGFSASGYAVSLTIFFVLIEAIWFGVGFLLFWRRADDWLALLAAFFLVMFNGPLALPSPALILPFSVLSFLGTTSITTFLVFFPNGRLIPRWMGVILLFGILNAFFDNFPSHWSAYDANWPDWLYVLVNLIPPGTLIFSHIYRYRRVSTPVQRQQTKWVIFGLMAVAGVYIGLLAVSFIPSLNNTFLYDEVWGIFFQLVLLLIPLSIGFSILRYRLWDIDAIINKALVYGLLTALLGALYVGLIIGLESLIGPISGTPDQPVVLVISTLVIAALFQPVRRRIQAAIDQRFYRRKYDVEKTLAAFSATLRHEVDLYEVREHLLTVVQETMQPVHVSLWLRQPERHPRELAHRLEPHSHVTTSPSPD